MKDTKKPKIRFKEFNDSWEQRKLSDEVSSIDTGKSKFDAKESGDYEILGSTGVIGYDDSFDYEGDFLLTARVGANAGTLYRHLGKVKITDNTVFLQGSHIDFVFYLLDKFDLKKMSFGSGQPLIKASELKCLELMMPVQNEEKEKIATYFLNLYNLITLHQRECEKLLCFKKSMLEKMFPKNGEKYPEIRFSGFTDSWEQRKLGELSSSFEYGLNAAAKEYDGENKYIRITDIDDDSREFKQEDLTSPDTDLSSVEKYKLSEGDILFARTGASVGKSYVYKASDGLVYYAGFLIRARIKPEYNSEFVFQNTFTDDYEKFIKVTSMRSGQPGVNAQEYSQYQIMMPSKPEQDKISDCLRNLDNLITLHQREVEKLVKLKKSMLEKMFI